MLEVLALVSQLSRTVRRLQLHLLSYDGVPVMDSKDTTRPFSIEHGKEYKWCCSNIVVLNGVADEGLPQTNCRYIPRLAGEIAQTRDHMDLFEVRCFHSIPSWHVDTLC